MTEAVRVRLEAATAAGLDEALPVVEAFYRLFGFPWDPVRKRALLAGLLERPGEGRLWLARCQGRVVGYALVAFYFSLEFDGRAALLDEFYLDPEFRGRGVGGALLEDVVAALSAEGAGIVRLEVDGRHPEAARLYARRGFVSDGRATWSRRLGSGGA